MPRSSTGCRNCVKRRIRCDETEPSCKRCLKANLSCGGRVDLIIITHTGRRCPNAVKHAPQSRKPDTSFKPPGASPSPTLWDVNEHISPRLLPLICSTDPKDRNLYFLQAHFQQDFIHSQKDQEQYSWINMILQASDRAPTANKALDGLAAAFFGKQYNHEASLSQARESYGLALKSLRTAIESSSSANNFDILATTLVLYRYENIMCTSEVAWIHHAGGISRLVQVSGPETFRDYPKRAILETNAFAIILEAYMKRKRTFLDDDQWRKLGAHAGQRHASFFGLQNLYARMPGLVEEIQTHFKKEHPDEKELSRLVRRCQEIHKELGEWMAAWSSSLTIQPSEVPPTNSAFAPRDADGSVYTSILSYSSLKVAIGHNVWRALKLTIVGWEFHLRHPSWHAGKNRENVVDIPELVPLAHDICRSLHPHFESAQSKGGVAGIFYLVFCSSIAYKALPTFSREAQWMKMVLDELANSHSIGIARRAIRHPISVGWREAAYPAGHSISKNYPASLADQAIRIRALATGGVYGASSHRAELQLE